MVIEQYLENPEDAEAQRKLCEYWKNQLAHEERKHKDWRKESAQKSVDVYWNEDSKKTLYPILHTVTAIKHSALYSEQPDPVVMRRFVDSPQWDKRLAQFTERALRYSVDEHPMEQTAHRVIDDWLLSGLGQWRLRYEAEIEEVPNAVKLALMDQVRNLAMEPERMDAMAAEIAQMPETIEQKASERIWWEMVPWKRFHWQPCACWEDCEWVAYDEYMTKAEIKDRFNKDPSSMVGGGDRWIAEKGGKEHEYRVTEFHHKPSRRIYVIGAGFDEPLEVRGDTLNLRGMFPSPQPLMTNPRSDRLMPETDYSFYQHLAERMNRVYFRIEKLLEQLKDCGFYDSALKELAKLQNPTDGMFVPVKNLVERIKDKNLEGGAIWHKPIENKMQVIESLSNQLAADETRVFRITGVTDIVQGMAAEVDETYGATRIKSNWAEIRLAKQFDALKQFMVTSYQMMAEVMLEHYDLERLVQITGVEVAPEEFDTLKDDQGRCYAIDIEHELSVAQDKERDAQARGAALDRLIAISQSALQLIPNGVWTPDFTMAAMDFAIRDFPEARSLADALQQLPNNAQQMQALQQQISQLQQELGATQQQLGVAQFELSKQQQAETAKDLADVDKKRAEALKTTVEAVQAATPEVPPDVLADEMAAGGM